MIRLHSLTFRIFLFLILTTAEHGLTQQPAANPQAPNLKPVVPLGMRRGTTLDLTLTGNNLADPTGVWTSFPAKVTIPTEGNNGKDNGKLLVRLDVPKDAPLGFHTLRLATRRGISDARLFCVDDLPQVLETATNHSPTTAHSVSPPHVIVGKADAEMTDYFKFHVEAGQRLSFEILGRRLGSAFDPQLQLLDAATGRELPGAYSNDAPGLQTDARLTHRFQTAGDYLVAVRDVSYRGGADFHYRLRIGDFPCATTTYPLVAKRGTKTIVRFTGPNVEDVAPIELTTPSDPAVAFVALAPRAANGLYGWPVHLSLSDLDEMLEKEPNDETPQATRLPVPGAITARFDRKGDLDTFVFAFKKGIRYVLDIQTHEFGSPTEVYAILRDAKGAQLQVSDPAKSSRIEFTPPADGEYSLAVEHLHLWGGPDEVYHLSVTSFAPSFELTVAADRFQAAQGGTISIPVLAPSRDFDGPIELSILATKGISGKLAVPAGKTPPANQPLGTLILHVADDVSVGANAFQIAGTANINGKKVTKIAHLRAIVPPGTPNPPLPSWSQMATLGLAVTEKPPFALSAKLDAASYAPGKPATVTVTATRTAGFTAEIALSATGLPAGVTSMLKSIPANQNEIKVSLMLTPQVKPGQAAITIHGKANHKGREYTAAAAPVMLVIKK